MERLVAKAQAAVNDANREREKLVTTAITKRDEAENMLASLQSERLQKQSHCDGLESEIATMKEAMLQEQARITRLAFPGYS
jgi:phage shock protein A